jgi:hypothetical protein
VVAREAQVRVQSNVVDAFRRSQEALVGIGGIVTVADRSTGRLEARMPMSFRSWGERVQVDVSGADGDVLVRIRSASRWPTTLIDWGKNADNLNRFLGWFAT